MKAVGDGVMIEPAQGNVTVEDGIAARAVEGSAVLRPQERVQMRPNEGVVRHKGEAVNLAIEVGDRVLFRWWTGVECRLDGVAVVLTAQKNVLAVVENGDRVEVE